MSRPILYKRQIVIIFTMLVLGLYFWHFALMNDELQLEDNWDEALKSAVNRHEKVVLALVSCGGRLQEAITMLKSAVFFSEGILLHVVAFADEQTLPALTQSLKKLRKEAKEENLDFVFKVKRTWFPAENERVWKELYAPCSTQRIFFPTLLPEVDSLLYMDSDTFFISQVKSVWDFFGKMNRTQWLAAAPEDEPRGDGWYNTRAQIPYYGSRGVNTGVMLLNLTRMRRFGLEARALEVHEMYQNKLQWGDQDIFNIILSSHPEFVRELPCSFNFRTSHCSCIYEGDCSCPSAESQGVHIVHGNRKAFLTQEHPFFREMYKLFQEVSLKATKEELYKQFGKMYNENEAFRSGKFCVQSSQLFYKNILV